ncbi:MAG: ABC transporter substrate-binding protein [Burkholderiaceae bacterium]|nr:ABC transporter substrate-binding protein [Burkholderiaceae bacterium]
MAADAAPTARASADTGFTHGLALGDKPRYGPDFTHFRYADPNAPKGGELRLSAMGTFDKLNPFTLKGIAARGVSELMFESLTIGSLDEPMSAYGLLAKDMMLARDRMSITFRLRPEARFSNGDPVTAEDVKFSFDTLRSKAASPIWRNYWADVRDAEVIDRQTIRFNFLKKNRELHMIVGSVPVFSRKWGSQQGTEKPFEQWVQDHPIASGPYVIDRVDLGKSIRFRRQKNYWAETIPSRKGQFNFDVISFRYYKDEFARIEAFKAGEFDFVHENAAKNWARSYIGSKFSNGSLIKTELPNANAQGLQAFYFNIRRPQFADVRVRQAIGLALDYEWMNRQLFYNQYKRSPSYFTNTLMAATGSPGEDELKLLNPMRDRLSPAVFGDVPLPPDTNPPHSLRDNLRQARALLEAAGWTYRDGALRNAKGQPFEFEVLLSSRTWERIVAPFSRNLAKLGISVKVRVTDTSLYKKRVDDYDYDMIVHWYLSSQSPGNELVFRFTSSAADELGADNFIGVKDPAVDALINRILSVESREQLVTATRALDRVLRTGFYAIPHWHNNVHRVAYRNGLKAPTTLPDYYHSEDWVVASWWWDSSTQSAAARLSGETSR